MIQTLYTPNTETDQRPLALARLAQLLMAKGEKKQALALCEQAIALAPCDAEVQAMVAPIFSHEVPGYHFVMIRDTKRNSIYDEVLRRAIRPGSRVLDIGAGTGLFAMMAARAGAAEVITCEANPAVAAVVTEVIAKNELAGRVRVVPKHSSDLKIGVDLDELADILVFDNVSSSLIADGVLPSTEQAVNRLMRPGAPAIPASGSVRVALADDRDALRWRMHSVEGFDLSPFNRLASPSYQIVVGSPDLSLRSEPVDLFRFDFQSGGPFPEERAELSLTATGGLVSGIAQWVRFDFDSQSHYENVPGEGAISAFAVMFYPLMRPIELAPGQCLRVCGSHDRFRLRIWAQT